MIPAPLDTEYAPYYGTYIKKAPPGDLFATFERQSRAVASLPSLLDESGEMARYAPGKWSVRELIGHLVDAERVFGYRAFCISRGDKAALPSFDEDHYVAAAGEHERPLSEIAADFVAMRTVNLRLFRTLGPEQWARMGTASQNPVSVRAIAYMMAGHVEHHATVLRERYGVHLRP